MEVSEVVEKIKELADRNGFDVTDNIEKIARAKNRMFGDEWQTCPCDRDNQERFCCSQLCQSDVRSKGVCHCNLFKRKGD